jgi:hypothetical protein
MGCHESNAPGPPFAVESEAIMGIDGIGKGAGPPPTADGVPAPGADPVEATGKTFQIDAAADPGKAQAGAAPEGAPAVAPSPLDRLRSGEVDLNGYIDLKVDQATAHLPEMAAADRNAIREMLRARLSGDPMLRDLVEHATGRAPPEIPEE